MYGGHAAGVIRAPQPKMPLPHTNANTHTRTHACTNAHRKAVRPVISQVFGQLKNHKASAGHKSAFMLTKDTVETVFKGRETVLPLTH